MQYPKLTSESQRCWRVSLQICYSKGGKRMATFTSCVWLTV